MLARDGEPIDVRRLVKGAPWAAGIAAAQVVDENEDDVRLGRLGR
jgi:hypothetical protein